MPDLLLQDFTPDWELLRKQKSMLMEIAKDESNDLFGLVHLIDFLQDQAEESGIWHKSEIFETKEDQYFQWEEKYKPIKNHINTNSSFDGTMFETFFGNEVEYVWSQDIHHVWTLIEGDEGQYIAAGRHHVNRLGYFITEVAWTDETEEYYSE